MSAAAELLRKDIEIDSIFSRAKWAFYFVTFLHEDTGYVYATEAAQVAYNMGLEVTIVRRFWEEETRDWALLDDREEPVTEIMEVFEGIISKCLIGNAPLVSSEWHEKSCYLKGSLIRISMDKPSCIGVDAEK